MGFSCSEEEAKWFRALLVGVARVLGESLPQLILQTSVLAAQGQSLAEQPLLLGSTLLSLGTAAKKVVGMTLLAGKGIRGDPCFVILVIAPFLAALWGLIFYAAAKLYFLEACPSRQWGLSTGCVGT